MSVETIIAGVLKREAGYVDNPADKGGPTKYGITEAVARLHGYTGDMRDLPPDFARQIYVNDYVDGPGFGRVLKLSQSIGEELIDTGVNMGVATAGLFLQRSLNVLNREGKLYPDIKIDGHVGSKTLAALAVYLKARSDGGDKVMLKALECLRGTRYIELAEQRPADETFVYGWLANRITL